MHLPTLEGARGYAKMCGKLLWSEKPEGAGRMLLVRLCVHNKRHSTALRRHLIMSVNSFFLEFCVDKLLTEGMSQKQGTREIRMNTGCPPGIRTPIC